MTSVEPTDTGTTVKALLDAAQLTMSQEEFDLFVRTYPALRAMLLKYNVPEGDIEEGLDELSASVRVLLRLRPQQFVARWAGE